MNKKLKPCTTTTTTTTLQDQDACNHSSDSRNANGCLLVDNFSSLPDELLIRILSLLPTKDAAATCFASKKLRRVLSLITTLNIDDSPIFHCLCLPNKIHQFPSFVTFVDTVLQSHQSPYLTRFRLGVGSDLLTKHCYRCNKHCLPNATNIHSWISFPLTRCGLRELDLRIHIREPAQAQLPPEIFTCCETLEVLKLNVNLSVDRVSTLTSFRLPNLKLLYLEVSHIYEDGGFVARLVSSCPLLEDLTVIAGLDHVQNIIISSPSLRILDLQIDTCDVDNTDFLLIHTPKLEYLNYASNLALQQSITNMDRLIKADIDIGDGLIDSPHEVSCQQILNFIRSLTNVHHLSLLHSYIEDLNFDVAKEQLPIFHNLKYLGLGRNGYAYWDKVLVVFLKCSPVLETLVFPQGMIDDGDIDSENFELEQELCRTGLEIIPWCCRFHLKRIVIENCYGNAREIDLIQFLLKHALVLEELVMYRYQDPPHFPVVDKMELQKTLQNLPRASVTSSIQVQ